MVVSGVSLCLHGTSGRGGFGVPETALKPKPNPMRMRMSCPDCGFIMDEDSWPEVRKAGFDCPRCEAHYSEEDFHHEHSEKLLAMHHNRATADLTQEEDD